MHFENNITVLGTEIITDGTFQEVSGEDFTHWEEQDTDNVATFSTIENGVRVDYTGTPTNVWLVRLRQGIGTKMTEGKTYKLEFESRSDLKQGIYARVSNINGQQLQVDTEVSYQETHRFRKSCLVFTVVKNETQVDNTFPNSLIIQFYARDASIETGQFFEVKKK